MTSVPVRPDLDVMEGYHSPQVDVEVRLNTNESPLPPPPEFVDELATEVRRIAFHRYPDRAATALREALAAYHGLDAAQVFCAKGSNEVLQCLLLAYGGPGRCVLVFEPTYALHSHIARLTGTEVVTGWRDDAHRLDLEAVDAALATSKPVVTFLCSPNNPTGAAESAGTVAHVLDRAPGLVVVDEAYGQFAPWSALDWVTGADATTRPAGTDRLVVVRTFSKTWSMAACRLGYLVADPAVVSACEKAALPYHLDSLAQLAGRLALRHDGAMQARVRLLVEERGRLAAGLAELDVDAWPSDANFILFRPRSAAAGRVWDELVARSVLVRDCSRWPGLDGCLRVSVGSPEENDRFMGALRDVLGGATRVAS